MFMEGANQAYYAHSNTVGQDFTTAPEISQVFGELIALWVFDLYEKLGRPRKLMCVELGPGRGTLLADLLRVASKVPSFYQALEIHLVETSSALAEIQGHVLVHPCICWHKSFEEIPVSSAPLIVIANEFFDTLPTSFYRRHNNLLCERRVACEDEKFVFCDWPLGRDEGPDSLWEESVVACRLMEQISNRLLSQRGAFLCLDYGYEEGVGDTLQALFKGQPASPLDEVGAADLTCHVNFKNLRTIALSKGLKGAGPVPQGLFLRALGIEDRIKRLKEKNPHARATLEAAYQRLLHPAQMGLLFKAMTVFFPHSLHPLGFGHEN